MNIVSQKYWDIMVAPSSAAHSQQHWQLPDSWPCDNITKSHGNGLSELMIKFIKGLMAHAFRKEISTISCCNTHIDSHLPSPSKLLYQQKLCTMIPLHLWPLNLCSRCERLLEKACWQCKGHTWLKMFMWEGTTICWNVWPFVWADAQRLWLPATVLKYCQHNSYLITIHGGCKYLWTCNHLKEHCTDATHKLEYATLTLELPTALPALSAAPCTVAQLTTNTATNVLYGSNMQDWCDWTTGTQGISILWIFHIT